MTPHRAIALLLLAPLAGCAARPPADAAMPSSRPVASADPAYWYAQPAVASATSPEFQRLWDAAENAARDWFFPIDRIDYRAGVLTTEPVVGGQWFEPWRREQQTVADVADSSLATVRRTIRFEFARDGDGWVVSPKVLVERESVAERRITSASNYRGLVSGGGSGGSREADRGLALPGRYFYPVARDAAMERKLTEKISRAL